MKGKSVKYVQCRICQYWVITTEISCPNCGHRFPYKKRPTYWSILLFLGSLTVHGVFYLIIIFSPLYLIDIPLFLPSLISVSLALLGSGIAIDTRLKNRESLAGKFLINDEKNINERIEQIDQRVAKIIAVYKRTEEGDSSAKIETMQTLLNNAREMLCNYKKRYQLEFWKIAIIRWKNTLEPIEFEWQQSGYDECTRRLEDLKQAISKGKEQLAGYEQSHLLQLPESRTVLADMKEALLICQKFNEGLLARQARLAINDVSPLDDKSKDLKTYTDKDEYTELFNARSDVTSFVTAFEELESEFDRLEAEDKLSLDF